MSTGISLKERFSVNRGVAYHAVYTIHYYPAPDTIGVGILFSIDFFCFFLFIPLSARLRENGWTDLHEIFIAAVEWPWDDLIQFWVNLEKPCDAAMLISLSAFVNITSKQLDWFARNFYFSGKVWSDNGTTWLHFCSIPRNHAMPLCATRGRGLLCFCTTASCAWNCTMASKSIGGTLK